MRAPAAQRVRPSNELTSARHAGFFRFFLGLGVGGDYPLSATIMSEYSNRRNRGSLLAAVFAMQGLGILTAAATTLLVTWIFKNAFPGTPYGHSEALIRGSCPPEADYVWRIVLALGCIPALLTTYARSKMPETPRYTLRVKGDADKAARDASRVMSGAGAGAAAVPPPPPPPPPPLCTRAFLGAWWKPLLGCAASWFLLDVACASPAPLPAAAPAACCRRGVDSALSMMHPRSLQPEPVPERRICRGRMGAFSLSGMIVCGS